MAHGYLAIPVLSPPRMFVEWLVELATGRRAAISVIVFAVFSATVLPWQAGIAKQYSEGIGSPDSSFWYTRDRLYEMAEAYGADGRSTYVLARVTFDAVWPWVYAVMLVLVLGWLLQRASAPGTFRRMLVLLPLAALVADYLENASTAIVMARWPQTTDVLATLAPVFTAAKWTLLAAAFLAVPVLAVLALRNDRKAKRDARPYYRTTPI
jgi:hypothetical protein